MVERGDSVTIQSGMFSGKEGEVRELNRDRGIATVAVEGFGAERETRVPIDDLTVAGEGDVDELWEAIEEVVREAVRQPFQTRRDLWWARRAEQGNQASPELIEEFGEFQSDLDVEFEEMVEAVVSGVESDLEGADAARLQRWLAGAADDLEGDWRERAEQARREFLEQFVSDEQLERLRREAAADEDADGLLDEQARIAKATGRLVSEFVDDGLRLWEESQERKSMQEAKGYRWESVAPGPVELEVLPPEDERPEGDEIEPEEWSLAEEPEVWGEVIERQLTRMAVEVDDWRGLETRSGTQSPVDGEPWELGGADGLVEVLEAVWGALTERMPNACESIYERCLAVAEIDTEAGPALAYLLVRPVREAGRQSVREQWPDEAPYDQLVDHLEGAGVPTMLLGAAPDETVEVTLEDDRAFSLPMGLRELRSRHGILRAPMLVLGGAFETLAATVEDAAAFRQANDGAAPDRFVAFGQDREDNRQVFDLDDLDMRHDPKAAGWARESNEVGKRHAFWMYIDAMIRGMMGLATG